MEGSETRQRVDRIFEYGYLLLVGITALTAFRYTTMLSGNQTAWLHGIVQVLRAALWALAGVKTLRELRRWTWKEFVLTAVLCGSLLVSWLTVRRTYVIELIVLIVGARGVEFQKIAKVWFGVCGAALVVTMALALGGVIENLVYYRQDRMRMAFGIIYPTDFAAHVFFLAACWAWLRGRRIRLWEIAGIAAMAVFCYVFCEARNSMLCLLLLAAGLCGVKLLRRRAVRKGVSWEPARPVQWLCVLSAPLLAGVMLLLSRIYDYDGPLFYVDRLMSWRLWLGRDAFYYYPVTLFGQEVPMTGWGGTLEEVADYFFLDCSYVNLFFCFGVVTLLCVLGAMVWCALREKRLRSWERLGILTVVALQCLFEHHLLEIAYNVFLLLPLAVSVAEDEREPGQDRKPE